MNVGVMNVGQSFISIFSPHIQILHNHDLPCWMVTHNHCIQLAEPPNINCDISTLVALHSTWWVDGSVTGQSFEASELVSVALTYVEKLNQICWQFFTHWSRSEPNMDPFRPLLANFTLFVKCWHWLTLTNCHFCHLFYAATAGSLILH